MTDEAWARLCSKCGARPGTESWGGSEPSFAMSHGFTTAWCKLCVLEAQIEYAEQRAAALPELRAEREAELQRLQTGETVTE